MIAAVRRPTRYVFVPFSVIGDAFGARIVRGVRGIPKPSVGSDAPCACVGMSALYAPVSEAALQVAALASAVHEIDPVRSAGTSWGCDSLWARAPGSLQRMIVGEGLILGAVGTVLGLVGALLSTRIVRSTFYGIDAVDPPTFAAAVLGVLLVGAAATLRPARRAARLDPLEMMRAR